MLVEPWATNHEAFYLWYGEFIFQPYETEGAENISYKLSLDPMF